MKTILGIVIGVFLGIIALGITIYFLGMSLAHDLENPVISSSTGTSEIPPSSTLTDGFLTPSPFATPKSTISSSSKPSDSRTASPTQTTTPASVDFAVDITSVNIAGPTSATITLIITNTGTADAHNVSATVEIFYQGSLVKIAGKNSFNETIGNLPAGSSSTTQATLNVALVDGLKILANGATVNLTVSSSEKARSFSYNFSP